MLTTIIVFVIALSLLIFVHELGHFLTAKKAGIKVDEFGFGFPPKLFGKKVGETVYSLNLLPIGGFVRIHGEDGEDKNDPRSFSGKSIGQRAFILSAGVIMNFLLAVVLFSAVFALGAPKAINDEATGYPEAEVVIERALNNSPAQEAGLQIGDVVKEVSYEGSSIEINKVNQLQEFVNQHKGQEITILIQRGNQSFKKEILAREEFPEDQGPVGVFLARTAIVSYPWYEAFYLGAKRTVELTILIPVILFDILGDLVTQGQMAEEVGGPVEIFVLTGQMAQLGLVYVLNFIALISVNLVIINILPIPALDGGRLLFLLIEKIKGSPVSQKVERLAHASGFIVLILLMIAITWYDVVRNFF